MQYTITLADGTKLTGLGKNGNNYVSESEVDTSVFDGNLSVMTVSDGEKDEVFYDMIFVQQMKWMDGTYYLSFRPKTMKEKLVEKITNNSDSVTDVQMALAELYEMILGGN